MPEKARFGEERPREERPSEAKLDPAWPARCLLRAARSGSLATSAKGQPYASLVTPACAPDLSVLLLLSSLSEHTRHLMADPRCSILVAGTPVEANPQTAPRLTITGVAERVDDAALKARFLAVHPYAALYADFGDFAMWRLKPVAGLFVGGFGRANRLTGQSLTPEASAVEAITAAEAGILADCNRNHADAMEAAAGLPGDWRMVTVDVDGFDLAFGERVMRIAWSAPVHNDRDVRRELLRLTQLARSG